MKLVDALVDRIAAQPAWRGYALVALGLFALHQLIGFVGFLANQDAVDHAASQFGVAPIVAAFFVWTNATDRGLEAAGADLIATLALLLAARALAGEAQKTTLLTLVAVAAVITEIFGLIAMAVHTIPVPALHYGYELLDPAAIAVAILLWVGLPRLLAVEGGARVATVGLFLCGSYFVTLAQFSIVMSALRALEGN